MQLSLHISLPARIARSRRTDRVAADFQMRARAQVPGGPDAPPLRLLDPTTVSLDPGQLAYLVGASGSGKSHILARLKTLWLGPVVSGCLGRDRPARKPRRPVAVLDTFISLPRSPAARQKGDILNLRTGKQVVSCRSKQLRMSPFSRVSPFSRARSARLPIDATIRLLSLAGLAEPRVWLSPPSCLSAGQADRLALAHLYARAERLAAGHGNVLLLIDEFASRLDRVTAKILASNLRRWLSTCPRIAVVVATAHDDLADALAPDGTWVKTCDAWLMQMPSESARPG